MHFTIKITPTLQQTKTKRQHQELRALLFAISVRGSFTSHADHNREDTQSTKARADEATNVAFIEAQIRA